MALSVNDFISEALKEGYKMDDLVGFMSEHESPEYQSWASNWKTTASAPEYAAGSADFHIGKEAMKAEYEKQSHDMTKTNVLGFEIPSILTGAGTGVAAIGTGLAAGAWGLSKISSRLKDRSIKNPSIAETVGDAVKAEMAPVDYSIPAVQRKAAISDTATNTIPEPKTGPTLADLKARVLVGQKAGLGVQPSVEAPNVPQASVPPAAAPQTPAAPVPAAVASQAPQQVVAAPVETAVNTGGNITQAIKQDIAPLIDEASKVEGGIKPRVRRTTTQIEEDLAKKFAAAPEGMLPAAPRKTNKLLPSDVIGQGGWHWYQGQMGPEAETEWLRQFGRTNQSYTDVKQAVKEGRLPVPAPTDSKKGGSHLREEFVPNYIKGSASLAQLGQLAMNALGAAGLLQAFKQGQETGDYSDFGLGAAGQVLSNIAPKAGLGLSLMAPRTLNTGEQEELAKRRKMKPTVD